MHRAGQVQEDGLPAEVSHHDPLLPSLLAGGLGADWFYLARDSTTYILVGTVKLSLLLLPTLTIATWILAMLAAAFLSR